MKLFAISDLHLDHLENRQALEALPSHEEDWLILAGDISHREQDLLFALDLLSTRWQQLVWIPGNHDLWSTRTEKLFGEKKYQRLVALCQERRVITPEDPYPTVCFGEERHVLAPLFLLYDYSFRPDDLPQEQAVSWAGETGILCTDEYYLKSDPFPSRAEWCAARCDLTEKRLDQVSREDPLILINHWPLRRDLIRILIPRFALWCGTRRTEQWHQRYHVAVVVSGHLHVRSTRWLDGVRFEEVSLGYPRQWHRDRGIEGYLRQILPGHSATGQGGP